MTYKGTLLIIENRRFRAQTQVNQESVLMFWEIGKYVGAILLGGERAAYGKQIVVTLAQQLSWSHFVVTISVSLYVDIRDVRYFEVSILRGNVIYNRLNMC